MNNRFDLIVIGAGSGGLVTVATACALGAKVLLIENRKMGGVCLNYGCVPSKTFLKSCHTAHLIKKASSYGITADNTKVSLSSIMDRVQAVIDEIAPHDSVERFTSLGATVVLGHGKLIERNCVQVDENLYYSKKIIIATGSTARIPSIPGLEKVDYFTNETIFSLRTLPKKMVVLGAGPIGLELGQGFAQLGSEVHVIDRNTTLFPKDEGEVATYMSKALEHDGVKIHLNAKIDKIHAQENKKTIIYESNGQLTEIDFDVLLVALGRRANTNNLGLEQVGIKVDSRGFIAVNDKLQTSIKNIYACGDVRGKYLFTHTASYEASIAVKNALIAPLFKTNYYNLPWTTFTLPEVAHVGILEKDAIGKGYQTHTLPLSETDKAKADDDRNGFVKIILNKKGQVVGATIVGEHAGEMIVQLSLMVTKKLTLADALSVIYQYPVQGEIVKFLAIKELKKNVKAWQQSLISKIVRRKLL